MASLACLCLLAPAPRAARAADSELATRPAVGPAVGDAAVTTALTGADDIWLPPETPAPAVEARPLTRRARAGDPAVRATAPPGTTSQWARTSLSLGGVVALIALLAWGYRAIAGSAGPTRWSWRGRQPALLELVSRTNLSPRQSLCLVRVGPRLVLLGLTPNAVHALDVIQDPEVTARVLGQASAQQRDSSSAEFAGCLEREAHEYDAPPTAAAEPAAPDGRRVIALRARLTETLHKLRTRAAGA